MSSVASEFTTISLFTSPDTEGFFSSEFISVTAEA
jgi:hypothetical protein